MKKRLIVVLAVLATLVGMAFAATSYIRYSCGDVYTTTGKKYTGTLYATADVKNSKQKCPACAEKEGREAQKKETCDQLYSDMADKNSQAGYYYQLFGCGD